METRTGKGVVIEEVSKHQETPLTGGSGGSFQISEGNLTGRKKIKPTDYMPKSNSQQKSTQTPTSATSKWGQNREEQAALLRVRTGPECPEGNWMELT